MPIKKNRRRWAGQLHVHLTPSPPTHAPPKATDGALWWEASFDIPDDAASLSFCVNSGDAWDNNGGADHKVRRPHRGRSHRLGGGAACLAGRDPRMRLLVDRRREQGA